MPFKFPIISAIVFFVLASPASAQNTFSTDSFIITKAKDSCGDNAANNADITNCINELAVRLGPYLHGAPVCKGATCMISIPCHGGECVGAGFSVIYKPTDAGNDIHIRLASGKKAEYVQCGTCIGIDPADSRQMPLELLPGDGVVILEFSSEFK